MKKIILLILVSIFIYGCSSKDEIQVYDGDYLIFGHFYGFCIGENCVEIFKLTNENLYEDSNDNYASKPFNFEVLDNAKFEAVKDLVDAFPTKLLDEKEEIIGCPDCADGGGLYIEYSKNGVVSSWRIDQMKNNVPEYLHPFMDTVNMKIALINK
ncbi:hypothetical protein EV196_101186 [Mariniflexile fucanivorans]|uniref:Lipoprotein n=1 Tax=Mariniflexile fucanivorans TaxID=264023 RepID=A0A4R1RQU0_9FLAO|nr:hypothetical protein [Mariniflexile fucanivorans]TCL68765.1 hypothetical protein EV196_101186 [Mariniflexile fucanivorans]